MKVPYSSYLKVNDGKLETVSTRGLPHIDLTLDIDGAGVTSLAVRAKKPVFVDDVRLDPYYVEGFQDTLSELAVPVLIGDKVIGVINMESHEKNYFTDQHMHIAHIIATHLSSNIIRLNSEKERKRRE